MEPDSESFATLYRDYQRVIEQFVYLRVGDRPIAEDLAAETFTLAWERFVNGEPVQLRWLFATARNLIGNEYQRRKRDLAWRHDKRWEEVTNVESWGGWIEDVELHLALRQLRPADALLLHLTYWEGLSAREAAQVMDCSTTALWRRLTRARAALAERLDDPKPLRSRPMGGEAHG